MNNERVPIGENITHYAQLKSSEYLGHWDLDPGKDYKSIIESIAYEQVYNQKTNKKEQVTVAALRGAKKRLVLNATNKKNIASLHGENPHKWPSKEIVMYRTETRIGKEKTDCIRIRGKNKSETATDSAE